ncbi:methyltransferase domain-containing protein [Campylobacter sp. MIT 21-1685]|uniref:CheR family methyltransferase n=1 Tax=unclassified Campylobacter TaxID=2593542 RepID=UPI00224AEC13|nr:MULTISPECIES: CheR family methyltransferase [unclassified Campylobacter]MCX2682833.1 methyltransferase domain-containing protein [Campylobacter sp. MIT 21-1684]MCX2751021.1 methyltransferase domain-containing protein [Campylobacter sp. MIT 21-1682]MCX2807314.1 methyltransferase domain-containing protein [Campylobacter sp. MIT 21-1685]
MENKISELELNEFIKIVTEISGIDLNEKRNILMLKLPNFISKLHFQNFAEFVNKIRLNKQLRQEVLDFVTIGETYFLRELSQLQDIVVYAKSLEKKVGILSAPCSSGEEVYSLALLGAKNCFKDMYILGIDINSNAIEKARMGKYQGRTLQRLSESEKKKFFVEENGVFSINKNEICVCKFDMCNVLEDKFLKLGQFDIVISRNMIIYFDYNSRVKLMEYFYRVLSNKGRLYVGNADIIPETKFFKKVFSGGSSYYEKM